MKRFENLQTRFKLLGSFGLMGILLLCGGLVALFGMLRLSAHNESIYKQNLVPIAIVGDLRYELQQVVTFIAWHLLAQDQAATAKQAENIAKADDQIDRLVQAYGPTLASEQDKQYYEQFKSVWSEYKEVRAKVLALSAKSDKAAAEELRQTALAPKLGVLRSTLDQLLKENDRLAKDSYEAGARLSRILLVTMGILGLVITGIGWLSSWAVTRFFVQGLGQILEATKQLRSGNLTYRAQVTTTEELGQLGQAVNQMADELAQTMEEMQARIEIMNTTSIVSEADLKGNIISANDKYIQVSKYSREELMGRPHSITRHPDMPKEVFREMWGTIGRGQIFRGVVKNRAKDGTPYYVDAVIKPIMGPNGKPRKYLGVRYDITESEMARHSMKGILEGINRTYAMIEFGLDGTVLTANEKFLQCLGYRLEDITGRHHRMFCDPAYTATGEYAAFWARLNQGEFDSGVYRRVGKGGKELWIQAAYCPVRDEVGRPFKVVKLAMDITAQKQAQGEVEKLIRAASEGRLSERIRTDSLTGSGKELAESFNRLLDAVTTPLNDAMMAMTALAANDLTKPMTGNYQGEFEQMKVSVNGGLTRLTQTLVAVREAVEAVSSGAEQITKGNEDLSQRTSEQASALEETSASMEEMTSTVKQNADNAKQANQLAVAARETANKGGAVTRRAVEAMGEINQSSKKIADIITVIDEIAFQTNLLALNAAVEAARAGEHGRGFAVVAAEVRNLAQRSASAAKEIKGLINESIQRVTDGSELVDQSGKTLEEIVSSVKRVTDIITEITTASQEQASGIDQVNKAIMAMDQTTQQNAALVEETTSASQSLKVQAKELYRRVLQFKIQATEEDKASMPPVNDLREFVAHTIHEAYDGTGERPMAERKKRGTGPTRQAQPAGVSSAGAADRSASDGFEEF